jgi:hypothetical protein
MTPLNKKPKEILALVTAVSRLEVFQQRLLSSPCLNGKDALRLTAQFNCTSAAQAFNAVMDSKPDAHWLVWIHQDVFLPQGWDVGLIKAIHSAEQHFNNLTVVGAYGIKGAGSNVVRAGNVLDRGKHLSEPTQLPHEADGLDELMFAVRVDSGLRLDPQLGFDFYATDLVLRAQQTGQSCAVVDAYCEHWSDTPPSGEVQLATLERIKLSAEWFEQKWSHRLPVATPCFDIRAKGDVARFLDAHTSPLP